MRVWKFPDQVIRLFVIVVVVVAAVVLLRDQFVPESFGELGHFPEVAQVVVDRVSTELWDTGDREDWRTCVKRCEWLLSLGLAGTNRRAIIATVEALGYVALAAVWLGDACKSKALVWYRASDNRLFIAAKRNRAGNAALKTIKGRRFHPPEALKAANKTGGWSVPGRAFAAFKAVVTRFYPLHDADWDALARLLEGAPEVPEEPAPPTWSIQEDGEWLRVSTPYARGFVADIKLDVPYRSRKWDPRAKSWLVRPAFGPVVRGLCERHFKVAS